MHSSHFVRKVECLQLLDRRSWQPKLEKLRSCALDRLRPSKQSNHTEHSSVVLGWDAFKNHRQDYFVIDVNHPVFACNPRNLVQHFLDQGKSFGFGRRRLFRRDNVK